MKTKWKQMVAMSAVMVMTIGGAAFAQNTASPQQDGFFQTQQQVQRQKNDRVAPPNNTNQNQWQDNKRLQRDLNKKDEKNKTNKVNSKKKAPKKITKKASEKTPKKDINYNQYWNQSR